ncbi:hypothetical protein [Alicyclobacillus fodiniaquatilis]|jgi:hypothetical protein|uniref:Uncharacterized protein n=1 Tax=Alicyclobacillus fodiniaquatilis TaxID=1661150 RepID=A0ABW4JJW7_9BACL
METEEQVGYRDAMRQLHKAMERRLHHLQEQMKSSSETKQSELHVRIEEVQHVLEVIQSLHR